LKSTCDAADFDPPDFDDLSDPSRRSDDVQTIISKHKLDCGSGSMVNKTLFSGITSLLPRFNVANKAGGQAYQLAAQQALAQLAATGSYTGTCYASSQKLNSTTFVS
jgi:hypothetical protein